MAEWKRSGGFGGKGGRGGGFKGEFKRGSFGKPRFGGGKQSFGGREDRGDREMFDAVCSSCGKDCQVPFKPTGKSDILCKECFAKSRGDEGGDRGDRRPSREDRRDDRREKPRFDTRTSFKDGRGERGTQTPDPRIDTLVTEMRGMNSKLEKLIELFGGMALSGTVKEIVEQVDTKKSAKKTTPKKASKKVKTK